MMQLTAYWKDSQVYCTGEWKEVINCLNITSEFEWIDDWFLDDESDPPVLMRLYDDNDDVLPVWVEESEEAVPTKPLAKFKIKGRIADVRHVEASRPFDDDFDESK